MRPRKQPIAFDIETMPRADAKAYLEPFDPASVKLGRMTDKDKIAATLTKARDDHESKHLDRAALTPILGRVIAIGIMQTDDPKDFQMLFAEKEEQEKDIIEEFWDFVKESVLKPHRNTELTGWNIFGFDIPFLIKRSWKWEIKVPELLFSSWEARPYWSSSIRDGMKDFSLGVWEDRYCSLNVASKFLGYAGKSGEVTGKNWHEYALGDDRQRMLAREYLLNDCHLARKMYERTATDVRGWS